MNNYCTNCGRKLENRALKCNNCNTYVVDLKVLKKEKKITILKKIFIVLSICIIIFIVFYNLYYKVLCKSTLKKFLKDDFKNAQYVSYDYCRDCYTGLGEKCSEHNIRIFGCFKYYYKSSSDIEEPDIIVYNNNGNISVDTYKFIINKYGFIDKGNYDYREWYSDIYCTEKRSHLDIIVDEISKNSITKIYEMVNEIITDYDIYSKYDLLIGIEAKDYTFKNKKYIYIDNHDHRDTFSWNFGGRITLIDPSLDEVKEIYE